MKTPRLPGTEKFRFCDKKYEQQKLKDEPDGGSESRSIDRKDSFLLNLHPLFTKDGVVSPLLKESNESLLCSCTSGVHIEDQTNQTFTPVPPCPLEKLNNASLIRLDINRRKPSLPISSRLTSRVFTLTNDISHLDEGEDVYYGEKTADIYERYHAGTRLPQANCFSDPFSCSSMRSSTASNLSRDHSPSPELSETKHLLHSAGNLLHGPINLMINATSHASLMSDESSTSISSAHRTECEDSYRSFSPSPMDHWAKHTQSHNRLSTSSVSSWEDESASSEVT